MYSVIHNIVSISCWQNPNPFNDKLYAFLLILASTIWHVLSISEKIDRGEKWKYAT